MHFLDRMRVRAAQSGSLLCVGLDPVTAQIPPHLLGQPDPIYAFCAELIAATADLACAFKPNSAFFEALGPTGMQTLARVIAAVPPEVPVILDAKRGDIGHSAAAYARAAFERLGAHALTVNPYLGADAFAPFSADPARGCILLCKTSNPGSADLQDIQLSDGQPLYIEVARRAQQDWNGNQNIGLVVGATYPAQLAAVRAAAPDLLILVPGVGAQGGDLEAAVVAGADVHGAGLLISASRSICYAGSGRDFGSYARAEAQRLRDAIRAAVPR